MKIAYISRHSAPYRDPVLRKLLNCPQFELNVYNELPFDKGHSFWDINEHGYDAKQLFPPEVGVLSQVRILLMGFVFGDYDFVLYPGFMTSSIVVAMIISALFGRKFGFSADTIKEHSETKLRMFIKRFIVRRASLIFVPGGGGYNFWRREYNVPDDKIVKGAYALDNSVLMRKISMYQKNKVEIRKKYGLIPIDTVFLMVANMIPTRHYPITTDGFIKFARGQENYKFIIVGNGPELDAMKKKAVEHPELIVLGGVPFDEMLSLYAIADVYVHGGEEPASTALVIGAIAGLPLASSNAVGCSVDVLSDGKSGVLVDNHLNIDSWACAFKRLIETRAEWLTYGLEARSRAEILDASVVTKNLIAAITTIVHKRKRDALLR